MPDPTPTSNVKIYDRPERKGPSPVVLILVALIVLVLGFGLYHFVLHPADNTPAPAATSAGASRAGSTGSGRP